MIKLPRYPSCFVCGRCNTAGADVTFIREDDGVSCRYDCPQRHAGYKDVIHGGMISALLDECIGWAVSLASGSLCVTAELTVRFHRPLPVGTRVVVHGRAEPADRPQRRGCRGSGSIVDDAGRRYARASGIFFPLNGQDQQQVIDYLESAMPPFAPVRVEDVWPDGKSK